MLKELELYLTGEMIDDYWYDSALFICEDILRGMSNNEWSELINDIPTLSNISRIRLAECLGEINNKYETDCLVRLINTKNDDLFVACIDSLRGMDLKTISSLNQEYILNRINDLLVTASAPVKMVLEEYIKKLM